MAKVCILGDAGSSHTQKWVIGLKKRGWDVEVISFRPAGTGEGTNLNGEGRGSIGGAKVHVIPKVTGTKLDAFIRARWVRKVIAEMKPDIVHSHYATSYGLLGALSRAHPFIISAWGSDIFQFPRQSFLKKKLLEWILSKGDVLCSTSHVMAEEMKLYIRPDTPIEITPFGVDTRLFAPDDQGKNTAVNEVSGNKGRETEADGTENNETEADEKEAGSPVRFGVAKNLHPIYGLDILIRAFAALVKESGRACELRIAGDGPEGPNLKALAHELGIGDCVTWAGALTNDQVADFYRSVDVVVVPSRQESFGVTAVEGLACGKPVIASRVGGLPEIVQDQVNGILVEKENPEALAKAMAALLYDRELREKMGREGRAWVLKNYDWEQNISIMENIYRKVTTG